MFILQPFDADALIGINFSLDLNKFVAGVGGWCGHADHPGKLVLYFIVAFDNQFIDRSLQSQYNVVDAFQQVAFEFTGVYVDHVHS